VCRVGGAPVGSFERTHRAARPRDEVKRLRTTELAVIDDPTAICHAREGRLQLATGSFAYADE
jgi:hypothetical protein